MYIPKNILRVGNWVTAQQYVPGAPLCLVYARLRAEEVSNSGTSVSTDQKCPPQKPALPGQRTREGAAS